MRAVLLTGYGGPDQLEYREDVPVPQFEPDEVLIKVGACGVNNTDIWTREAAYSGGEGPDDVSVWPPEPLQFPFRGRTSSGVSRPLAQTSRLIVDPTFIPAMMKFKYANPPCIPICITETNIVELCIIPEYR